jgi:heptosyltransferase-3
MTMSEFTNVKKVLVLKLRNFGDVLLTAPVFRALKGTFPSVQTTALVNSGMGDVLAGNPEVDDIISFQRVPKEAGLKSRLAANAALFTEVRSRGFDMTVDLTSGDRPAIISYLTGARYRLAADPGPKASWWKRRLYTHLAPKDWSPHTVLQNMAVLSHFGITTNDLSVNFHVPPADREKIAQLLTAAGISDSDRLVHIHPTSRWLFKCWDEGKMGATIHWLIDKGFKVVLTTSPDPREMEVARRIMTRVPASVGLLPLLGETSLKELAAISCRAELFFGVDSAPMHIAAAVGTPVVALFGPTGAYNWGPWDNEAAACVAAGPQYPARNGMQTSGIHTLIQQEGTCVPCGRDGCNGSKISDCLMDIPLETVISILAKKLLSAGENGSTFEGSHGFHP